MTIISPEAIFLNLSRTLEQKLKEFQDLVANITQKRELFAVESEITRPSGTGGTITGTPLAGQLITELQEVLKPRKELLSTEISNLENQISLVQDEVAVRNDSRTDAIETPTTTENNPIVSENNSIISGITKTITGLAKNPIVWIGGGLVIGGIILSKR